jgi:hypothetical protein
MYNMSWAVEFETTDNKKYILSLLGGISLTKSTESLSDTASITLPETVFNKPLSLSGLLKRGDKVSIKLGYNNELLEEFRGYILGISNNGGSITINAEDDMFRMRKSVKNKAFKEATLKSIADYLKSEIGGFEIECNYDIGYESFVIHKATAYDVLQKLKEETNANIYFKDNVLHIHPVYYKRGNLISYDFYRNIESANLQWKEEEDKKLKVVVEFQDKTGKIEKYEAGDEGGDTKTIKIGSMQGGSLKSIAQGFLTNYKYTGYEGSITTWLVPYCEPTDVVELRDQDYEYKGGRYYVKSVTTEFNENGGSRSIQLGLKLSE